MKWCWHRWSKWETYTHKMPILFHGCDQQAIKTELRQKRHCMDCGKTQDEWLRNG